MVGYEDGAADRVAQIVVALVAAGLAVAITLPVVGIQSFMAVEPVGAAVKVAGAAFVTTEICALDERPYSSW
jgi:hypothetical protein